MAAAELVLSPGIEHDLMLGNHSTVEKGSSQNLYITKRAIISNFQFPIHSTQEHFSKFGKLFLKVFWKFLDTN